jgi:hypothetical protein
MPANKVAENVFGTIGATVSTWMQSYQRSDQVVQARSVGPYVLAPSTPIVAKNCGLFSFN